MNGLKIRMWMINMKYKNERKMSLKWSKKNKIEFDGENECIL
jgi:hypothetical protein